jgi:hypothetical protein
MESFSARNKYATLEPVLEDAPEWLRGLIQYVLNRKRNDVFLADITGDLPLQAVK